MSRATQKARAWDRLQRMLTHRDNPAAPVDSATLLRAEANRLRSLNFMRPAHQMAWAFDLAAAKLDTLEDPAMRTRFQRMDTKKPGTASP